MNDRMDALFTEVARRRELDKPFWVTATEVFEDARDDLDSDTLEALEQTGRASVAASRVSGITMWRATEDAQELSLPDGDDLDAFVRFGFLVLAAEWARASYARPVA